MGLVGAVIGFIAALLFIPAFFGIQLTLTFGSIFAIIMIVLVTIIGARIIPL